LVRKAPHILSHIVRESTSRCLQPPPPLEGGALCEKVLRDLNNLRPLIAFGIGKNLNRSEL
jgi:hypothetical protein